ncbi:MAG: hypothetical protein PCFJNLEI_00053 [Verrucomicrobiae bacterium]|nr:hypothetical protein [Verrucomicrobiae bacterium]
MSLVGLLGLLVVLAVVAFLVFGLPAMRGMGNKAGGLFFPGDDGRPAQPEYSLAEARLQEGRYDEAIAEYRKIGRQYPQDVYVHVKIAEIAVTHLDDIPTAEVELLTACTKATTPDTLVMTHNKFADLYQFRLNNPVRALEIIEELRGKIPGSPAAQRAEERCTLLKTIVAGHTAAKPPTKIVFRKRS